ncbi:MAG: hypothetical protein KBA61_04495 [Spirochaetes bacterium]|nr:hypothetical protein [Spirochaetota bacterium]
MTRYITGAIVLAGTMVLAARGLPLLAQAAAPGLDSRVPAGAGLYVRAAGAPVLAGALALYRDRVADGVDDPLAKWMADFKLKSGIDVTDAASLKKAGIDIAKPAGLARYASGDTRGYLALLPVTTGRSFPYTFTKLLQRSGEGRADLAPAITRHGKHATFQVQKDIFYAADGHYFLLSSSGDLLRKALDLGDAPETGGSMAVEASFIDFASKLGSMDGLVLFSRDGFPADRAAEKSGLRYAGVRLERIGDSLSGRLVLVPDPALPDSAPLIESLKPGGASPCPRPGNATFYIHLELDLKAIAGRCSGKDSPLCGAVKGGLDIFERYYGLDFYRELLPRSGRGINLQVRKGATKGAHDDFLLFVEKDASVTVRDMRRSLFREVEKRASDTDDTEIGKVEALVATDARGRKTVYAVDERGIFISNSEEFLASGLEAPRLGIAEACDTAPGAAKTPGIFSHVRLNLNEESVVKTMALLALYGENRLLYNLISAADYVTATGSVTGGAAYIDITAKLVPARKSIGR